MSQRLTAFFDRQRAEGRKTLVTFLMGLHPAPEHFDALLASLPAAGVDVIEIGMPFSDPMADGPVIQVAGAEAIKAGASVTSILEAVKRFRAGNDHTPLILMGYFNPIFHYGVDAFCRDAAAAGIDGVIIVDVPLEEQPQVLPALAAHGLAFINLITPATPDERVARIAANAGGFLYGVAVAGVTGTKQAEDATVQRMTALVRRHTALPLMIGFGIRTPEAAARMASLADGAVVGSALIERVAGAFANGLSPQAAATEVGAWLRTLADAVHGAGEDALRRHAQGG